jgi:hypothetical protein
VALPIMTGVSTAVIADVIKDKLKKGTESIDEVSDALTTIVSALKTTTANSAAPKQAEVAITRLLLDRGLTSRDAEKNATAIVNIISARDR